MDAGGVPAGVVRESPPGRQGDGTVLLAAEPCPARLGCAQGRARPETEIYVLGAGVARSSASLARSDGLAGVEETVSERTMIQPLIKDDAFLADVARAPASADELRVWWLGQSGFLVRHGGSLLLLDPYLSDSLTRKYAATDKPHTRMTERVITPGRLAGISVATSSHNHTD